MSKERGGSGRWIGPYASTMFERINAATGDFDGLIKSNKGGLQRCQLDEQLDRLVIGFLELVDLLTTARQSWQREWARISRGKCGH